MTLETALKKKLAKIFDCDVTLDAPGESNEQGVVFVSIERASHAIKEQRHVARVEGRLTLFAQASDLPMGFFAKAIAAAYRDDTESFYFFDLEGTNARGNDIVERTAGFVFFFNGQYDPDAGIINEVNLNVEVSE